MRNLAFVLLATVAVLGCAVHAVEPLAKRPIAAIAVMHCDAIVVVWIVEPTKVTRFDVAHPPSDPSALLAQINAAMFQDAIAVNCTPHPVDTARTAGLRK